MQADRPEATGESPQYYPPRMSPRARKPRMSVLQFVLRVPFVGFLLLICGFGLAWHGLIAARDFEFFLGMPGWKSQMGGLGIALAIAFALVWPWRKIALIVLVIFTVPLVGLFWWALDDGMPKPLTLMTEVGPATSALRQAIPKAHESGQAGTLEGLLESGALQDLRKLEGEYYGPEDYSWVLKFDAKGQFVGTIHVRGDPSRNAPDWTLDASKGQFALLSISPVRDGLPILKRERARNEED